jgi:hypothetical protein
VPIITIQPTSVLYNKKLPCIQIVTPALSQEHMVNVENAESLKGAGS